MNRQQRLGALLILQILCIILSGCWDRRELQERSIVLAVGIDLVESSQHQQLVSKPAERLETFVSPVSPRPFRLSIHLLSLTSGKKDSQPSGNTPQTYVLTSTGLSFFEMVRDIASKNSHALWFEHMQIIIISEEVLKEYPLAVVLDFFHRDSEFRWRTRLFTTPGEARTILTKQFPTGEPGGLFLASVFRNSARNPHIPASNVDLGSTIQRLDNEADIVLPRLEMDGNDLKLKGMALFKQDKLIAFADEYAIKGLKFILGLEKSALVSVQCPDHPGHVGVFELFRHDTLYEPHVDGDSIYFTLSIAMRGNLGELSCANLHGPTSKPEVLKRFTSLITSEIQHNIAYSHDVCRQTGVDAMRFANLLKAHKPEAWAKVKNNWDEVFPTIPIYTSVKVAISNIGEHN